MELNARMICILQEVIEAQDSVTVDQICGRNDISKRTFYYDIKNVNAWLREKHCRRSSSRAVRAASTRRSAMHWETSSTVRISSTLCRWMSARS